MKSITAMVLLFFMVEGGERKISLTFGIIITNQTQLASFYSGYNDKNNSLLGRMENMSYSLQVAF